MFVKYSKGTYGIVEYLKLGVSKDRDFARDEMDYRVNLEGNVEELDIILRNYNKSSTIGDNYKHFVITFESETTLMEDLVSITKEFKAFAKAGYEDEELYFYAEAHIPKLKGYPHSSGEYNNRKPHVHCIIPVFNLYTGNKGYNFNIGTFKYRKYLDLFSKKMNYKYSLNSPFENENKKLFKSRANQILKKTGVAYKSEKFKIKEEILKLIVDKKITNHKELAKMIKLYIPNTKSVEKGSKNKNILILNLDNGTHIALNDFAFSETFVGLEKEIQLRIYDKYKQSIEKTINTTTHTTRNSKLTQKENRELNNYMTLVSKIIKYSKVKPVDIHNVVKLGLKQQRMVVEQIEKDFYKGIKHERIKFRDRDTIEANLRAASYICKSIEINTNPKQNYSEVFGGRVRNKKSRVDSIYNLDFDKNVLNKVLEVKYGSNPTQNFNQNYNLLSLDQKAEIYEFVGKNYKCLKDLKFENSKTFSNFYNGELNKIVIDNYKRWLNINKNSIGNKSKGILKGQDLDNLIANTKQNKDIKMKIEEYNIKKFNIESEFQGRSKVIRQKTKDLKLEYLDVFVKSNTMDKVSRENLQISKPSLRNNTIVNDSFIQFLEYANEKNIIIPQLYKSDLSKYIQLVNLCKNKELIISNIPKHDIIHSRKSIENIEFNDDLTFKDEFTEYTQEEIKELLSDICENTEAIEEQESIINIENKQEEFEGILKGFKELVKKVDKSVDMNR